MGYTYTDELYHFGIKGMKWGIRRYQNEDGTLTEEGRAHYGRISEKGLTKRSRNNAALLLKKDSEYKEYLKSAKEILKKNTAYRKDFENVSKMPEGTKEERAAKIKAQDKFFDDMIKSYDADTVHTEKSNGDDTYSKWLLNKYGEKRISELSDFYETDDYNNASDIVGDFYQRSLKESGDWYHQIGVSQGFKEYVGKNQELRNAIRNRSAELSEQYKEKYPDDWKGRYDYINSDMKISELKNEKRKNSELLVDTVIKDLGYIPTKKARKALDPIIRWD